MNYGHSSNQDEMDVESGNDYLRQITSAETSETWHRFYLEKSNFIRKYRNSMYAPYMAGLDKLNFNPNKFPTLEDLRETLKSAGWDVMSVPGFIPGRRYSELLLNGIFPIASTIRSQKHLLHSPVPDAIHDIWGHLPLLFDRQYCNFLRSIAEAINFAEFGKREHAIFNARNTLGLIEASGTSNVEEIFAARENLRKLEVAEQEAPELFTKLSRFFLWSIEFGIIGKRDEPKLLGAALLSSFDDAKQVLEGRVNLSRFSVDVMDSEINFTELQSQLFVAKDISEYSYVLQELTLSKMAA